MSPSQTFARRMLLNEPLPGVKGGRLTDKFTNFAVFDLYRCIIVDSTRKGKRVPDALSKTIPIWCATINNAVRKCALQNQAAHEDSGEAVAGGHTLKKEQDESSTAKTAAEQTITTKDESGAEAGEAAALLIPALNGDSWDTRYHSLPSLISRSEHVQIADKIEGFAEKLMVSGSVYFLLPDIFYEPQVPSITLNLLLFFCQYYEEVHGYDAIDDKALKAHPTYLADTTKLPPPTRLARL